MDTPQFLAKYPRFSKFYKYNNFSVPLMKMGNLTYRDIDINTIHLALLSEALSWPLLYIYSEKKNKIITLDFIPSPRSNFYLH